MRPALVAFVLLVAGPVAAQELPPDVRRVFVLSSAGDEIRGHLLKLGPDSATLLVQGARRELSLDSILRIETEGDSIKNGAFIGAGIGVVAGLLSAADVGGARIPFALFSAAVWGLMGAGVDALIPGRTVIYRRSSSASTPASSAPHAAVSFRIRF